MLTNLFSIFDVSLYKMSPFFITLMFFILIVMVQGKSMFLYNNNSNVFMYAISTLITQFHENVKNMSNFNKNIKNMSFSKLTILLFISVFFFNFYSLFPYILSITSHMSLNMNITFLLWTLSVTLALASDMKSFFAHLTPTGTPIALMSFMVMIETVSNIIRPLTLAVRLMANMVAGHLLLTLLSKFSLLAMEFQIYSAAPMLVLGVLEMGVSLIQAYVITLLCVLYMKEAFN